MGLLNCALLLGYYYYSILGLGYCFTSNNCKLELEINRRYLNSLSSNENQGETNT